MGATGRSSNSTTNVNSDASSLNEAISNSFGMSGGRSTNFSNSYGQTFVDPNQQGYLDQLRGGAFGVGDASAQQGVALGAAQQNQPGLTNAMGTAAGLMDPSAQIEAQSAALQSGLGSLFRNEINPGIESEAIAAGGLGGGRQGVAQGVAAGQLGDAFTQGYGDIVGRANQQALGAAGMMPGLANANMQNALQPMMAGLDIQSQLANILGGPTILSRNTSRAGGASNQYSRSGSQSTALGQSNSQSRTKGKTKSGGFGFSLLGG